MAWLLSLALGLSSGHVTAAPPSPPASSEATSETAGSPDEDDSGRTASIALTAIMSVLGSVGLGAGIWMVIKAGEYSDRAAERRESLPSSGPVCRDHDVSCTMIDSDLNVSDTYASAGPWIIGLNAAGLAGVAVLIGLLASDDDEGGADDVTVAGAISPDGGALRLGVRF